MAYPAATPTLTDAQSVQSILESESGILDCMAEYFCSTSPNSVVSLIQATTTIPDKLNLLNAILPAYSNKENSIAKVLQGAAAKMAADSGVSPCDYNCPTCKSCVNG